MESKSTDRRILFVPFDHLHHEYGVLKQATKDDVILFVESQRMVDPKKFHPVRLYFLVSSAMHFAQELRAEGFTVEYLQAESTLAGIAEAKKKYGIDQLRAARQSSFRLQKDLESIDAIFCENDFFLTPPALFASWAQSQKSYLMENFYRKQRVRLNILMDGNEPLGGQWNYDKDNRDPLPKGHQAATYLEHETDEIDRDVAKRFGIEPSKDWATTRAGARRVLKHFLEYNFATFGRYEDAMNSKDWAVHHSLLSPYINNGLFHPSEVIKAAIKKFAGGTIPIESCEAFVRQIIGWREYINGMYWHLGQDYRERNGLNAARKLLPLFTDSTKTKMNCVKSIIADVEERSWVHHIPRLMVLSNLALIAGVNPQEYLEWMRVSFIDASDWVMVPNVIGMGVHADSGEMMTKPYAAGGAYISRMSDYCKGCIYDPKKRTGDSACPFTTLYWDFLDRNRAEFAGNHRMAQQLAGINRLSDLEETRERAQEVLQGLEAGKI
jgi:deoxyribodipyrimidine photolyase-related protein